MYSSCTCRGQFFGHLMMGEGQWGCPEPPHRPLGRGGGWGRSAARISLIGATLVMLWLRRVSIILIYSTHTGKLFTFFADKLTVSPTPRNWIEIPNVLENSKQMVKKTDLNQKLGGFDSLEPRNRKSRVSFSFYVYFTSCRAQETIIAAGWMLTKIYLFFG